MIREDFHIHSTFSDGAQSPEEIILEMIRRGATRMGFTDHGYASYDDVCMARDQIMPYCRTIRELAEKYRDRITVYCGIEQDIFSDAPTDCFDYVIGSVHYLKLDREYITIDDTVDIVYRLVNEYFQGDMLAMCEAYYETVATVVELTDCDIIGHFDLVAKLNQKYQLFDEYSDRYTAAWKKAADTLLKTGRLFEINTGAVKRYRDVPYPRPDMMQYLSSHGAKFILSSDSHKVDTLFHEFDTWEEWAEKNHIPLSTLTIRKKA